MDVFTDDSKHLLNKEWLIKIDNANSQPYLFKFHYSDKELRCCLLITDTRNVWFEALEAKQLARRWRRFNETSEPFEDQYQEDVWRSKTFSKLSSIHTLKSMQETLFSIEDSHDADIAVELQPLGCKWRWECNNIGPKTSAEILSKHLILPLLSVAHLSFTSADPVSELSIQDLEQAVDKVAKTGRRSQDVHVRQTLSRPRVATTLRRMTAMFNFAEPIPPTVSVLDEADEDVEMAPALDSSVEPHAVSSKPRKRIQPTNSVPKAPTRIECSSSPPVAVTLTPDRPNMASEASGTPDSDLHRKPVTHSTSHKAPVDDSATESESDGEGPRPSADASQAVEGISQESGNAANARSGSSSRALRSRAVTSEARPDSASDESSPPRPAAKRAKTNIVPEDSSGDSEDGRKKATNDGKPGPGRGMGVRQPIKRGGRRF